MSYIALFVCMPIRVVLLELVTDLSTGSCFVGMARFLSRRGRCTYENSDNGRNFVGAANRIKDIQKFVKTENHKIAQFFENNTVDWLFIPPSYPLFREAGIKVSQISLTINSWKHFFVI